MLGIVVMSASLLLYGLSYFIPDHNKGLFVACSVFARLLEGGGLAIASTSLVSLISKLFPTELSKA